MRTSRENPIPDNAGAPEPIGGQLASVASRCDRALDQLPANLSDATTRSSRRVRSRAVRGGSHLPASALPLQAGRERSTKTPIALLASTWPSLHPNCKMYKMCTPRGRLRTIRRSRPVAQLGARMPYW